MLWTDAGDLGTRSLDAQRDRLLERFGDCGTGPGSRGEQYAAIQHATSELQRRSSGGVAQR